MDGVPTQIYPANLLFRAVFVPAGAHTLELRYQPSSFRYGLWLALVALLLCLVMTLAPRPVPAPAMVGVTVLLGRRR